MFYVHIPMHFLTEIVISYLPFFPSGFSLIGFAYHSLQKTVYCNSKLEVSDLDNRVLSTTLISAIISVTASHLCCNYYFLRKARSYVKMRILSASERLSRAVGNSEISIHTYIRLQNESDAVIDAVLNKSQPELR